MAGVPARNVDTSFAGIRKLKPCTMEPLEPASVTAVRTPITVPSFVIAGPPLLPCAAEASVWIMS